MTRRTMRKLTPAEEELRSRPFPQTEYASRLHAVQARMVERQISSLVVVDPANLYYLTGYNAWSFYTPQCLIVPVEGDQLAIRLTPKCGCSGKSRPEGRITSIQGAPARLRA